MSASSQAMAAALGQRSPGAPSDVWLPGITPDDIQFLTANVQGLVSTAVNGSSQIQVDNGYDFYWYAFSQQTDSAGVVQFESGGSTTGGIPVPLVTVLINDSSANRNLMNVATPLMCICGTGERPYRLIRPRLFPANTLISFTWVAYQASGTTYTNLYHVLHGYRIRK
jgi:hypothetical protein